MQCIHHCFLGSLLFFLLCWSLLFFVTFTIIIHFTTLVSYFTLLVCIMVMEHFVMLQYPCCKEIYIKTCRHVFIAIVFLFFKIFLKYIFCYNLSILSQPPQLLYTIKCAFSCLFKLHELQLITVAYHYEDCSTIFLCFKYQLFIRNISFHFITILYL